MRNSSASASALIWYFRASDGLEDVGFELFLPALDLELLDLDGLFFFDHPDLGFFLLDLLAELVALELVGKVGLGLLLVDEDLGFGLLRLVFPLGLGDLGFGLEPGHFSFFPGLGRLDDGFFLAFGFGDGGVALGGGDQRLAQGVDIALGVAEFLEGEGQQDEAHFRKNPRGRHR